VKKLIALALTAGLAAGLVSGCGIPDETPVRVDGPGPSPGTRPGDPQPKVPPERNETTRAAQFVKNFLSAPAGEMGTMPGRLEAYVSEASRGQLKPTNEVSVVKLIGEPALRPDSDQVTIKVRHVGVLTANGELAPPTETDTTYTMGVGAEQDRSGLWVKQPPPVTLMSVEALQSYYWQRTIYFYNNEGTALVPDLRYLPMEVQRPYVPTKLLSWLAKGPSSSLDGVAQPLPGGSAPDGTAPLDGSTLTVTWTEVDDPTQRDRIVNQVVWSLREVGFTQLVFRVGGESYSYDDAVLTASAAYTISDNPQRYAIDNGVVHRLSGSTGVPPALPLTAEVNRDVLAAAFTSGTPTRAAVVVSTDNGPELRVGQDSNIAQEPDAVSQLRPVGPALRPTARPVWLPRPEGVGLVAAGGDLHKFTVGGRSDRVALPGVEGAVTAVAVSPDGSRITVIAGGQLHVVPIAGTGNQVVPKRPREITTTLTGLTAVGWTGENRLVVAGAQRDQRAALIDITVDGGVESVRVQEANGPVTMIASYPDNAVSDAPSQPVMFEAGGLSWRVVSPPQQIGRSEIADVPAPASSGAEAGALTSPFYVY
jgi:hypothetical protein